jgi:hypothetical protein
MECWEANYMEQIEYVLETVLGNVELDDINCYNHNINFHITIHREVDV